MGKDTESKMQWAKKLAEAGFYVFPLSVMGKTPIGLLDHFKKVSTRDPLKIHNWWTCEILGTENDFNVGISTHRFQDDKYLIAVDVDNKKGRDGDADILGLELEGKDLPDTFEQSTPSGGRHLLYWSHVPVGNNSGRVAPGLDVRGVGGFVVGCGSETPNGIYTAAFRAVAEAPQWLIEACGKLDESSRPSQSSYPLVPLDQDYAARRAKKYLDQQPGADEGTRGSTAYKLSCRLKDFGCSVEATLDLLEEWASRCDPPMPIPDLITSINNAYKYGRDHQGSAAPEADFTELPDEEPEPKPEDKLSPIEELNEEYAFIIVGGHHHILHETVNDDGEPITELMAELAFHRKFAGKMLQYGSKKDGTPLVESVTKLWMNSKNRRSYKGFCFRPRQSAVKGYYNLWRGFTVTPSGEGSAFAQEGLRLFLEHALENVCGGEEELFHWLMGWFAHLVQKPWEKPLVAIVFKGRKGVGKNALVDRVGHLLNGHYLATADRRYLVGNFNSHLEKLLLFTLNEAFWSGDKQAEGILKELVTGSHHVVERKGMESRRVKNLTRICILGNEDWVIPASEDERRYAVFNVGIGRQQDQKYFTAMREGMEAGGYALLLDYLEEFDLSTVNPNLAPTTEGLMDQKLESMGVVHQWWHECLAHGEIADSGADGWPVEIAKHTVLEAFRWHVRNRNIRSRVPDGRVFTRALMMAAPSTITDQKMKEGESYVRAYRFPPLEKARKEFQTFLGGALRWE